MKDPEFICAECGEEFIGTPRVIQSQFLCNECCNAPMWTKRQIANYLAGFASGPFDEVQKIGGSVFSNALAMLNDSFDGIKPDKQNEGQENH